ncbi:hypothetical protein OIO90_003347 [Microbotryomycetes sp. JL221]|nr:hypothetical protein OIO90_003347 [Microbotryomycetes sp. JL221]
MDCLATNTLTSLPAELVLRILTCGQLDTVDATRFGATCKSAQEFVTSVGLLWRRLFELEFDDAVLVEGGVGDSSAAQINLGFHHRTELIRRTMAKLELARASSQQSVEHAPLALESRNPSQHLSATSLRTLIDIALSRKPSKTLRHTNSEADNDSDQGVDSQDLSKSQQWLLSHLGQDFVKPSRSSAHRYDVITRSLARLKSLQEPSSPLGQHTAALAHLHTLQTPTAMTLTTHRLDARENVYEAAWVCEKRNFGPFNEINPQDGSYTVNWPKLEALTIVMAANLRDAAEFGWGGSEDGTKLELPLGWSGTRRYAAPPGTNGLGPSGRDWAGIEDCVFNGTYAFLDYRSFSHYNFHRRQMRNMIPSLEGEDEAVGDCMVLDLQLLPPGQLPMPPDHPENAWLPSMYGDYRESDDEDFEFSDDEDDNVSNASTYPPPSSEIDEEERMEQDRDNASRASSASDSTGIDKAAEPTPSREPFTVVTDDKDEAGSSDMNAACSDKRKKAETLSFCGRSEPLHFAGDFDGARHVLSRNRSIRGTVCMTSDGQVHWRMMIRYSGRDQWVMNGVQIGGPRSKYGIIGELLNLLASQGWQDADEAQFIKQQGYWTSAEHEEQCPSGPFWYFPKPSTTDRT